MQRSRQMTYDPVIAIVGPTASGKSSLAQDVACAIGAEIISADSMQIYRGMDIGTGKVMPKERRVTHYGLDIADPGDPYSASLFQSYARECIESVRQRKKRIVMTGGTGFYIRAALDDFDFPKGDQLCNPVRDKYTRIYEQKGEQALWDLLNEADPDSAALI
ncbi:MAG: (d)CMP kinase, partial [Eggerthellaceae bacterium]|nr:(d)CMP kinase [Eggerthellaceae bacterium]